MLLNPFEKEFHLPAAFVKLSNGHRRQAEVVGQEDQTLVLLGVEEADAPQFVGKILAGIEPLKENGLVEQ